MAELLDAVVDQTVVGAEVGDPHAALGADRILSLGIEVKGHSQSVGSGSGLPPRRS